MKRFLVFAIMFSLAVNLAALQPAPAAAQTQNCFIYVFNGSSGALHYWATQPGTGSTFLSNPIQLAPITSGVLVVVKGTAGLVGVRSQTAFPSAPNDGTEIFTTDVQCTDNNNEFNAACDRLGIDFADVSARNASVVLTVFRNGVPVAEASHSVITPTTLQLTVPTNDDPNAYYSYELRCVGNNPHGTCIVGNRRPVPTGRLIASGPLSYLCPQACGPSLAGAPLGRMLATVPLHAAPNAGAASPTFSAEAGKTFKMLGTQGGFMRIALGCQSYWVPSNAIAQCADPLCRD